LFSLQFSIQVNCTSGNVEGLGPVGEAFLLDDYLMASGPMLIVDGAFPTNAPSISMSAPEGVDSILNEA
jgi:hypothetical protein